MLIKNKFQLFITTTIQAEGMTTNVSETNNIKNTELHKHWFSILTAWNIAFRVSNVSIIYAILEGIEKLRFWVARKYGGDEKTSNYFVSE